MTTQNGCPTFEELNDCFSTYPLRSLTPDKRDRINSHVTNCSDCSQVVEFIRIGGAAWAENAPLTQELEEVLSKIKKPF